MPFTIHGCGTTFYGKRDFRLDGTYITTEWLVFAYLPLFPIRSPRVSDLWASELGLGDRVYEKALPNWKQVLCVYGFVTFVIAWVPAVLLIASRIYSHFPDSLATTLGLSLVFIAAACIIALPLPIPWILRHHARKRVYDEHDA